MLYIPHTFPFAQSTWILALQTSLVSPILFSAEGKEREHACWDCDDHIVEGFDHMDKIMRRKWSRVEVALEAQRWK